jgi:hypothetical protein
MPGNWILALVSALLAIAVLGGVGVYQSVRAARPIAEAVVQLELVPPRVLPDGAPIDPLEFARFRATQANMVSSHSVVQAALRRPGISSLPAVQRQGDPIEWLAKALVVECPDNSGFAMIRLDSAATGDLSQAVQIVNAVANEFVDYSNSLERLKRSRQVDQLRTEVHQLETRLAELRKQEGALKKELGPAASESADMTMLAVQIENQQRIFDEIQESFVRLEVELGAPARVYLVQEARVPEEE